MDRKDLAPVIEDWPEESICALAHEAIRFPDLTRQLYLPNGGAAQQPKFFIRRLYWDGLALARFEIGAVYDVVSFHRDANENRDKFSTLRDQFLRLPARVVQRPGEVAKTTVERLSAKLLKLYVYATTRQRCQNETSDHLVQMGIPVMLTQYRQGEVSSEDLGKDIIVLREHRPEVRICQSSVLLADETVQSWSFLEDLTDAALVRRVRMCVFRLHAELQLCRELSRAILDGKIPAKGSDSLIYERLREIVKRLRPMLYKQKEGGLRHDGIKYALASYRRFEDPVQLEILRKQHRAAANVLEGKYREFIERKEEIIMGDRIDIKAGEKSFVNVKTIVNAPQSIIQESDSLTEQDKHQLHHLLNEFGAELEKLKKENSAKADFLGQRLEEVTREVAKQKGERDRGVLELTVDGLKNAAAAVAGTVPTLLPVAKRIADFVLGLAD